MVYLNDDDEDDMKDIIDEYQRYIEDDPSYVPCYEAFDKKVKIFVFNYFNQLHNEWDRMTDDQKMVEERVAEEKWKEIAIISTYNNIKSRYPLDFD